MDARLPASLRWCKDGDEPNRARLAHMDAPWDIDTDGHVGTMTDELGGARPEARLAREEEEARILWDRPPVASWTRRPRGLDLPVE